MMDMASWETGNSKYLSLALACVRLRLTRQADLRMRDQIPNHAAPGESALTALNSRSAADAATQATAELAELKASMDPPPALELLRQKLGLSEFEQNVLLLCVAAELDTTIPALCAAAQGESSRAYPTFALALSVFDQPTWEALSPERPLRFWRLIDINQPAAQALTTSSLRVDERILNYVKGLNYLDDRLAPYVAPMLPACAQAKMPESQQGFVDQIISRWRQPRTEPLIPTVQLLGTDMASKHMVASRVATIIGHSLYRMAADALPHQASDLELLARLWQRESVLLPVSLYIDWQETDNASSDSHSSPVRRFLARSDGFFFLASREAVPRLGRDSWTLDIAKPTGPEQQLAWEENLRPSDRKASALLADQFNLNVSDIQQIAERAKSEEGPHNGSVKERVWDACRVHVRPFLDSLAHRLEAKATWDDIVLPSDEMALLRQIAAQVRQRGKVYREWGFAQKMNRGLGISALFAGESGTGKTMAAEVIANDLRLNLYRIDLSAVVNKYIGETEKNLRRLFDAAEDGGAILFFDEADALFGKRSEVKDSHDRYANIEINYLLQRMESYRGLAILASNMRSALDAAFTRRLRFIVSFPFPSAAERKRIWQKAFPVQTPLKPLDYDRLSRLNLTGGSIHNAAINAAFIAAEAGKSVTMTEALAAARSEFIKLDRPISEADFHWLEAREVVA